MYVESCFFSVLFQIDAMTKIGKIIVVLIAFGSLAFMGFAFSVWSGGPNWQAEAEKLTDYVFEYTAGENPSWTGKEKSSGETIKTSPNLASVVIAAQTHKLQKLQNEISEVQGAIPPIQQRLEEAKKLNAADLESMKKRQDQLAAEYEQLNNQIVAASNEARNLAQQAHQLRTEAEHRREDVFRLQQEIAQIRTESYALEQKRVQLVDQLHRVENYVLNLERRHQQLTATVGQQTDSTNKE